MSQNFCKIEVFADWPIISWGNYTWIIFDNAVGPTYQLYANYMKAIENLLAQLEKNIRFNANIILFIFCYSDNYVLAFS